MKLLVSACLLGVCCRYDGKSKGNEAVLRLAEKHELIPVCPEQLGGLPTPRPPAEIQRDRVINRLGQDVTAQYQKGAEEALRLCQLFHCELAVLKARSPSCGCGLVYDGCFSGTLVPGDGFAARLLRENGIKVLTEENVNDTEVRSGGGL
ncbi:MAG: DUF523 domain-containing protein [Clostridia bacterium]|nr:DUF523 domain-containing protein [Clostridia bacterium]